jgi:hypothetical protein
MSEEFQERVKSSGALAAKIWYWSHVFHNVCAFATRELRRTPLPTVLTAAGFFLAVNAVTLLYVLHALWRAPLPLHAGPWWTLLSIQCLAIWGNALRQGAFWLGCLAAILHRGHRVLSGNAKQFIAILPLAMIGASALLGQADSASAKWVGR